MQRLRKLNADCKAGLFFVAVGVVVMVMARGYDLGSSARMGAGYFPAILGLILAVLGGALAFRAFRAFRQSSEEATKPFEVKSAAIVTLSIVLFAATVETLGLIVALPLLIIVSALAADKFNLKRTLVTTVILTAVCALLFVYGLGLLIPLWPDFS